MAQASGEMIKTSDEMAPASKKVGLAKNEMVLAKTEMGPAKKEVVSAKIEMALAKKEMGLASEEVVLALQEMVRTFERRTSPGICKSVNRGRCVAMLQCSPLNAGLSRFPVSFTFPFLFYFR